MAKKQLQDSFGRPMNYLRLAVTDRCNLRCFYCMPAEGINFLPRHDLLSYEEMIRLVKVFISMGVDKVRLTGGEPFSRKDFIQFVDRLVTVEGLTKVNITTNGVLSGSYIPHLKSIGINSLNLSLDTIDKKKFEKITRRNVFDDVWNTYQTALTHDIDLKVNMVVMNGKNDKDIIPMAMLTKNDNVSIRYIEEMPFNGKGVRTNAKEIDHVEIMKRLESEFGKLIKLPNSPGQTATEYAISGHIGKIGIIPAWSRTFCGDCNRIRVTSTGGMRNCLYEGNELNLKALLRNGASDAELVSAIKSKYVQKNKNGFISEQMRASKIDESMTSIGG